MFQKCLKDATVGLKCLRILEWSSDYVQRPEGGGLTDSSGKKYLEDLLAVTRHGLEIRPRTDSGSSAASITSSAPNSASKTADRASLQVTEKMVRTQSLEDDMRYIKHKIKLKLFSILIRVT